jgi:putative ABC transport system ATP-binding protein
MAEPIIKIQGLEEYYDKGKPNEVHALKKIDLEINAGEYVAFFGPSGCGKTTLLYAIAGIEKPDSGKILIHDRDLMGFSQQELAIYRQIGVGIVFQNFNLIPSIPVLENVTMPMSFIGVPEKERIEKGTEILGRLGIKEYRKRLPHELSGGQQQRVGIARALANNPPIILADEPLGNLDSENAEKVLEFLKKINREDGQTIVMVTHEAWSLKDADRIFHMRDGQIVQVEERQKKGVVAKRSGDYQLYTDAETPALPAISERAHGLAGMLLRGFSQHEVRRFEEQLSQLIEGKISIEQFRDALDKPYAEGGVGLWRQRANRMAEKVKALLGEEKEIEDLYRKLDRDPELPMDREIEFVRDWLFREAKTKVSPFQQIQLHEAINERLRQIISNEDFLKVIHLPKSKGGVGLSLRASFQVAEKLEAIISSDHGLTPAAVL